MSILAIAVGLFTGLVILVFRVSVEYLGYLILPAGSESFEALSYVERFSLPVAGALVLGLVLVGLVKPPRWRRP